MENRISSFIVVFSILIISTNGQLNLICNNAQSMYDASKNVNVPCTTCDKCDAVSPGFYFFKPNAQIPNFCPTMYVCLAEATYWTNDTQPTASNPGPFNITLCLSLSTTGNDANCRSSCSTVQTAFCSNLNTIIYELMPVPQCNIRYCFQEFIPCGKNESSLTGYQPCQQNFPFDQLTNGTTRFASPLTDNLFTNIPGISAKCTITCPSNLDCSQLSGDVLWFSASNASPFLTGKLLYDPNTNSVYGYAEETQWLPHINTFIRCDIIPSANGQKPYFHLYTDSYYFGMYLGVLQPGNIYQLLNSYDRQEITLTLDEASKNKAVIEVYSTIPILCKNSSPSCSLKIQMSRESVYKKPDEDLVRVTNCNPDCGACMREIKSQIQADPTNKAIWDVITTVEAGNTNVGSTLSILLIVKSTLAIFGDFWNNLKLPKVKLIYNPKNMTMNYYAYSYNDPHMKSFDGTYFEFQGYSDEYLMVENKDTLLWIHAIATHCNTLYHSSGFFGSAYCNDRLYIQSIDDLIIHDVRYPDMLYYKDLSVKSPSLINVAFDGNGNSQISKQNAVQISRINGRFRIITHFATIITISYDGNFEVYPSKLDYSRIWGLLGNYDKDPTNDLTQIEGGSVSSTAAYFETYKIKAPRPFMSKGDYYKPTNNQLSIAENLTQYCMCTNTTGVLAFKCPLGLTQLDARNYQLDARNYQLKRSLNLLNNDEQISIKTLVSITKKIENFHALKVFIKNENEKKFRRFKRAVTDSCEQTLNIAAFQSCSQQGLINLNAMIQSCKLDFNLTGDDLWTEMYHQSALSLCTTQLTQDKNTFINVTGEVQMQTQLLSKLCINNCTNHGDCVLGKCNCTFPYTGDDCSLDRTIPANIYNSSMENNVCDIHSNESCTTVILILDKVTPNMSVANTKYYKTEKYTFQQIGSETETNVISFSRNLIYVNLNLPQQTASGYISVAYYNITITDLATSEPFIYAIYDSRCQTCRSSNDCFVNAGTCNIDSDCYQNGDINPNNRDQICNYTNNQFKWSSKPLVSNIMTSTPPIGTTGLAPSVIAAIVVPIAVVLLLVVAGGVVAFIIIKRRGLNK